MKGKRIFLVVVLWVCVLGGAAQESRSVRLQLKWWPQFQFAGYYAAEKMGYYRAAGLKVNILPADSATNILDMVLSGKADFGILGSDLVYAYAQGKPVMAMGAIFQHSPYVIISLPEKNINTPTDLVGKRIMATPNQGWVEIQAVILKEGINPDSIKLIPHTWRNSDLVSGYTDAMTGYRSVEMNQLAQMGLQPQALRPIDYGVDFYGDVLFAEKSFAKKHSSVADSFLKASFRGWQYAFKHKEEICDYLLRLPGMAERGVTKAALMAEAVEMEKLVLPEVVSVGHMNRERWMHIMETYRSLGIIPTTRSLDDFIYEPKPGLLERLRNLGYYTLAVIGILVVVLLAYAIAVRIAVNRRTAELRRENAVRKLIAAELKKSHENLQKIKDQLSLVYNTVTDVLFVIDVKEGPEYVFTSINQAFINTTGLPPEEVLHKNVKDIVPPNSLPTALRNYDTAIREKRTVVWQEESEYPTGSKTGIVTVTPVFDTQGNCNQLIGSVYDITDTLTTRKELVKLNERYEHVTHATFDVIWDWDMIAGRLYWGANYEKVFGHPVSQHTTPEDSIRHLHPADRERILSKLERVMESGGSNWQEEYRYKRSDGSYAYVEDKAVILRNDKGEPYRMIGAMRDVSGRKEEQQQLKLLETAITNAKDAVVIAEATRQSKEQARIVYVNNAFTSMTGYTREEAIGRSPQFLLHPDNTPELLMMLREALATGSFYEVEVEIYRKNGESFWNNFSIVPVSNKKGEYTHIISIARDITDRKLMEAENIKKAMEREALITELSRRNDELSRFSFIVSHNLRAPVTNLMGIINLLEMDKIRDAETKTLITGFISSARKLDDTLNDLIGILFIKNQPTAGALSPVSLDAVSEKTEQQLAELIQQTGAVIRTDFQPAPTVLFNEAYMENVFQTLVTNSLQYIHPGTKPEIDIASYRENGETVLQFRDNGIGMQMHIVKNRIFGLYQRFHNGTEGKGIGLYVVQTQLQALGASISFESAPDKGATFTLRFPGPAASQDNSSN